MWTSPPSPPRRTRGASDPPPPTTSPAVVAAAVVSGVDWSPSQIAEEQARGALLVAVPAAEDATATATDTPIAGLVVARVVADVEVQILEVAVHPTLRRRGLGARLVRAALDLGLRRGRHPRGARVQRRRVAIIPAVRIRPGRALRAGYYADGEDAVLMTSDPCRW